MQARRIARELALLSISQLPTKSEQLNALELQNILVAAVRTLTAEVQDTLESAAAELKRGSDRLLESETRAVDVHSAHTMVNVPSDTSSSVSYTALWSWELISYGTYRPVLE